VHFSSIGGKLTFRVVLAVYGQYIVNQIQSRPSHELASPAHYSKYLEILENHKKAVETMPLDKNWGERHDAESESRYTTFQSSFQTLISEENMETTVHILILSAFLGMATIRESFFSTYQAAKSNRSLWLEQLGTASTRGEAKIFSSIIEDLHDRGLIQSEKDDQDIPDGVCYSLPPDIRAWIRMRPESTQEDYGFEAVLLLSEFIWTTKDSPTPLQIQLQVLTHLDTFLSDQTIKERIVSESCNTSSPESVGLCFANFYRKCSRLKNSKNLLGELLLKASSGNKESNQTIVDIRIELGNTLRDNAEYKKAEKEYLAMSKFAEELDPARRCRYLIGLADAKGAQQHFREARKLGKEALRFAEVVEDGGRLMVEAQLVLAEATGGLGNVREAGRLVNKAFAYADENFRSEDNLTLEASIMMAGDLMTKRQPSAAKERIENALDMTEAGNGPDHRLTLQTMVTLGRIYGATGHYKDARNLFMSAKSRSETLFGDTASDVQVEILSGYTYASEEKYEKAESQYELARKKARKIKDELILRFASGHLFLLYLSQFRFREAIPVFLDFAGTFPFYFYLKTNRVLLVLGAIFLLLLILSGLRGYLATVVIGSVVICIVGLFVPAF
jgi:tetratricopeptide (TPR) repeat protein